MGLLKTAGRAAVASSVHGRVQRRQQQRWAAQDQMRTAQVAQPVQPVQVVQAAPPAPPAPAPTADAGSDMERKMELLRQLGELRDSGVLSDAEFEVQKAKVLHG